MPTAAVATSPGPELAQVLGASGEAEYRRLLRVVRAASGRFALLPVESDLDQGAREALLQRLASDLAASGISVRVVRLSRDACDPLQAIHDGDGLGPDGVLVLVGLGETPGIVAEPGSAHGRPPALGILNHAREALRSHVASPVILWCDPLAFTALQEHAPDLFDHFTSLFTFFDARPKAASGDAGTVSPSAGAAAAEPQRGPASAAAITFYEEQLARFPDSGPERARALLGLASSLVGQRGAAGRDGMVRARAAAEDALGMLAPEGHSADWARGQVVVGDILSDRRSPGFGARNLRRAIASYEAALRVYTEAELPVDWATVQNNLGIAYRNLPTGDRGENLRRAIACCEAALRVYTEAEFSVEWATTQNNLGNAYMNLPAGDRGENLRRAIACYEAALRVYSEVEFPLDWAMAQNNLGIAYRNLPVGDRGENLRRAIACYEAAMRVYSEAEFPLDWAMAQNNLGIAYRNLPVGDRVENLRRAIACYEAALRVRTEAESPLEWSATQNNLGTAYAHLPVGDRGENLRRAIACYEAALRVYTEAEFPLDWAMTQHNLGIAYRNLPTGDRGENLCRAIACYEAALRVRTEPALPMDYAGTHYNLALALAESGETAAAVTSLDAAARAYRSVGHEERAGHAESHRDRLQRSVRSGDGRHPGRRPRRSGKQRPRART